MRLPQELLAEALWIESYFKDGFLTPKRIEELLRRYNLKLKKGKTLDDIKRAFGRGFKGFPKHDVILEQVAEEIDNVCIIARWDFAIGKYSIKEADTMETKMYLDFIRDTVADEGIKIADIANKKALEAGKITTEQYSAAARILVEAYLGQDEEGDGK